MLKEELDAIIFQAIGEASMCWNETPTGVFASTKAVEIGEDLCKKIFHELDTLEKEKEELNKKKLELYAQIEYGERESAKKMISIVTEKISVTYPDENERTLFEKECILEWEKNHCQKHYKTEFSKFKSQLYNLKRERDNAKFLLRQYGNRIQHISDSMLNDLEDERLLGSERDLESEENEKIGGY